MGDPTIVIGAGGLTGAQGEFHEIDLDGWLTALDVNFFSEVRVAQAFLPGMRADKLGVSTEEAIRSFVDEDRPFMELKRRGEAREAAAV